MQFNDNLYSEHLGKTIPNFIQEFAENNKTANFIDLSNCFDVSAYPFGVTYLGGDSENPFNVICSGFNNNEIFYASKLATTKNTSYTINIENFTHDTSVTYCEEIHIPSSYVSRLFDTSKNAFIHPVVIGLGLSNGLVIMSKLLRYNPVDSNNNPQTNFIYDSKHREELPYYMFCLYYNDTSGEIILYTRNKLLPSNVSINSLMIFPDVNKEIIPGVYENIK
jgi:hypothetical protein